MYVYITKISSLSGKNLHIKWENVMLKWQIVQLKRQYK